MRISKEPEERKQEILEIAIKLFAQNGFEKTSISDIAREIGVAQGLCYRYFPSKDVLFQTALDEYANMLISKMTKGIDIKQNSLKEILNKMTLFSEHESDTYYQMFHDNQNKNFHDLLALCVCKKLTPIVQEIIIRANQNHEINISDPETCSSFCAFGQLGILMNNEIALNEKSDRIKAFFNKLFNF